MYICICNAVTESAIRQAVREGARNIFDLTARTGCSTQCGRCAALAAKLLDEELAALGTTPLPVRPRLGGTLSFK